MKRTWSISTRPAPGRFSEGERRDVDAVLRPYCKARIPPHARDQVELTYRLRGTTVTLLERRPAWRDPGTWIELPIAQFRFILTNRTWRLFWRDRNIHWHPHHARPAKRLQTLIQVIETDPSGIFWG